MAAKKATLLLPFLAGIGLLGYGLWALYSGKVISTWGQLAYRPSLIYWITVIALIVFGASNVCWVLWRLPRD